jgi:creatinine amidohydrolase/Fe(II)-dependent formamide hydrolase-like protein
MRATLRWTAPACALFVLLMPAAPPAAQAQVYQVAEMTADEIRALDRERTVVILTGGILEQHGPYLPSFSDGYWSERLSSTIADAIVARPGWTVLMFPTVPLGNSGANDIGGRFSFPGTYGVRFNTLRAVFMDLASELGEQGFRRIMVVHAHGAPNHNRALDQAGDYFRDTYGGFMVNVSGLLPVFEAWEGEKTEAERIADGLPIHAGMDETSWMLFLRPQLVRAGYRTAPPMAGAEMEHLVDAAAQPGWRGYFGAPALASAAHGARIWHTASGRAVELVLGILDGADAAAIPRFADIALDSPVEQRLDRASLDHEAQVQRKQDDWISRRGYR